MFQTASSFYDSFDGRSFVQMDIVGAASGFDDFILVGKGQAGSCGENMPILCCQSCMKAVFVTRTCNMKRCPNCWEKWSDEQSMKIATILAGAKESKAFWRYPIKHITISPDPSLYDLGVDELRCRAISWIKKMGKGRDGVLIFHAHRPNERFWREYDGGDGKEETMKKWEWIRSKENWKDYVEYSPHFHFVGYAWMRKPEAGDEWIYKTIQIIKEKDKKLLYKLRRVASYLLSHTVDRISETHFVPVTWIGRLSVRSRNIHKIDLWEEYKKRTRKLKEERKKSVHCKSCGGGLWFMQENMKAFFRAWLGVEYTTAHDICESEPIMARIFANFHLEIVRNVAENLWLLTGDPPVDAKKYQIADYNRFIASQE